MALPTIGLVLLKTVQLQNHETALCQLYSFMSFICKTQKPVNWQIVFQCFPFSGLQKYLGFVGVRLGSWHKAPRVRAAAPLWPRGTDRVCSLGWLLVLKTVSDKCPSFPNGGGAVTEVVLPLRTACTSSAALKLKEKGDGRSYFYFLLGTREKKGGTLYHVILEKKKKSDSIEILPCLLCVLLLLSPSVFG